MHDHQEDIDLNLLEEMGYEHRDVDAPKIYGSTFWFLVISTILMGAGLLTMYVVAPQRTMKAPPEASAPRRRAPDAEIPLIQGNATELQDMKEFAASQKKDLTTYAWTDRKTQHVRIPVEEALKKVVAQGLPMRPNAVKSETEQ